MMTAYFSQLSMSMTGLFVRGFAEIAECLVSTRRLQVTHFLNQQYILLKVLHKFLILIAHLLFDFNFVKF